MDSANSTIQGRKAHLLGRRAWLQATLASAAVATLPRLAGAQADPLPSWNDGEAKRTILAFVSDVTRDGGPRFVEPADRVATFDNDGTLWCEKPTIEGVYMAERIRAMLRKRPELRTQEPYATLVAKGGDALPQLKVEDLLRLMADTHTGMTEEEFSLDVQRFFATAKHPKFSVSYLQMTYLPQLEFLRYLRDNGFTTWICSGGEVSFMRFLAQQSYGIPTERVIGTYFRSRSEEHDGRLTLRRVNQLVSFNDKDAKPMNIQHQIGRRPILAVGNERSGGDIAMLRYSQGSTLPSLAMLIDHDDRKREYSYDEPDGASLEAARRHGFAIVSMKRDWRQIFTFQASHS